MKERKINGNETIIYSWEENHDRTYTNQSSEESKKQIKNFFEELKQDENQIED